MGQGFPDPVAGGGGNLIRERIASPNFNLAAKTGWAILQDGSAYFFNVTAAGAVTSNTVVVAGSGDGIFIYDGTPGPGTLILSIASASGADPYGNPYSGPGISLSAPGFENEIQIRPDLKAMLVYG